MSNRSLIELNHDYGPRASDDEAVLKWGRQLLMYRGSGNAGDLPDGLTLLNRRHHSEGCPIQTLALLRVRGWMVAVHNDYVVGNGRAARHMTFWLFTNPTTGRFVKGEGLSDAAALQQAADQMWKLENQ